MIAAVSLAGCGKGEKQREPSTPQEMYARVRELLKPSTPNTHPDPQQAMRWLHRAAENGFLRAQTDLGGIYLQGGKYGIAADGKEALKWFAAASNQGSKEALYYIGLIHKRGQDVPRDGQKALSFWRQAAKAGVADASLALGAELVQRPESIQEGIEWLKKTVATREAIPASTAAAALGNLYATGRDNIPRDMKEAARWYEIAANGGDARSQLVYALLLLQGEQAPKNTDEGMRYLRLAAGQNHAPAIALLIEFLRKGQFTGKNEQEAAAWEKRLKEGNKSGGPQS